MHAHQHLGITYSEQNIAPGFMNILWGTVDSSYGDGDPLQTRKSTSCYCFYLNGGPIQWLSTAQCITAGSPCEAERIAQYQAAREAKGLRYIIKSLGYPQDLPTPLLTDSSAAKAQSEREDEKYSASKAYDMNIFKAKEYIKQGIIKLFLLKSEWNSSDLLTKITDPGVFIKLLPVLMGTMSKELCLGRMLE